MARITPLYYAFGEDYSVRKYFEEASHFQNLGDRIDQSLASYMVPARSVESFNDIDIDGLRQDLDQRLTELIETNSDGFEAVIGTLDVGFDQISEQIEESNWWLGRNHPVRTAVTRP